MKIKYQKLKRILSEMGNVLIAFSGGVDSTLLLKAGKDELKDRVMAITAVSETTPKREQEDAIRLAANLGVKHQVVSSHEMDLPEFVKNHENKCYICKKSRFTALIEIAKNSGFNYVVSGENLDDYNDFRPGIKAIRELGVRSPLAEAELTKAEVRQLSKKLKLPTWDKPSMACLASRIAYFQTITPQKLAQVDSAERFLADLGMSSQIRVRHEGNTARIELDTQDFQKITGDRVRGVLVAYIKKLGFKFVTLDLEGYRMGSLNQAISGHIDATFHQE